MDISNSSQPRVRVACARCRAQKLRCDLEKPCSSCLRRGVDCVPRSTAGKRRKKGQPLEFVPKNPADEALAPDTSVHSAAEPPPESARSSWLGLAKGLLRDNAPPPDSLCRPFHALPWAPDVVCICPQPEQIPIKEIINFDLPGKPILDEFLDAYFDKTQWFMLLFHEPSFRQKYERIFGTGFLEKTEVNFLQLCLLLFSLGARHSTIATESVGTAMALEKLRKALMSHIEAHFMSILDVADIHTVQICLLLGAYVTYEGRLARGFALVGSAVTIARMIGLSYEPGWKEMSPESREESRRTWWALEIVDKFDAVKSGRSTGIVEAEIQVSLPEDMGDVDIASDLPSLVTYHHCKFMLYGIVSPVLSSRTACLPQRLMKSVDSRLQEWESNLPPHLQWGSAEEFVVSDESPECQRHAKKLRLQKLALHSSYSILKMILHKPYVFAFTEENESQARKSQVRASKIAIFETALRVSSMSKRFPIASAEVLSSSSAATQCGITMFTAGVVLGYLALTNPTSSESQTARNGISRIIGMQSEQKARHILMSPQSAHVLEDLVHIIQVKQNALRLQHPGNNSQTPVSEPSRYDPSVPKMHANAPGPNQTSVNASQPINTQQSGTNTTSLLDWPIRDPWSQAPGVPSSYDYAQNDVLNDVRQVMIDRNAVDTTFSVLFGDVVPGNYT